MVEKLPFCATLYIAIKTLSVAPCQGGMPIGAIAMLPDSIVAQIRQLLSEEELSQREIARRLGVSRGTVHAIAVGRRPDRSSRRRERLNGFRYPSGPPRRCPGCGGLVQMPCLLCYLRSRRQKSCSDERVPCCGIVRSTNEAAPRG